MFADSTYLNAKHKSHSPLILVGAVLTLTLLTALVCAWLMLQTVASYYAIRIYPNVYVTGVKLGRLTPDEATTLLSETPLNADSGLLVLYDDTNHWPIPWSEAGMQLDVQTTIQAAFAVGHADQQPWPNQIGDWLRRHDVAPVFTADPERARQVLERLAPALSIPPSDATLNLPQSEDEPVIALPGQPGRELDIEATLANLLTVANGQTWTNQVELVFRSVPPGIAEASALQAQVEEMLNRRIIVSTHDVLTDESFKWVLWRGDILPWLRLVPLANGPTVTLDQQAVRETLAKLSAELGAGRGFRLAQATEQVLDTFNMGGGTVTLFLTHPERPYTVQSGDTLSGIAAAFGMTPWHIMQANPSVDPNWLYVDQTLTIPSQDELTRYTPVPGKRVIVSTSEQRMRAYEHGELIYDWSISTGVAKSPTHTGVFQILSKEKNAYASLWDLWMPHFVAVYAAGPGFFNGFHGLPTLSNGRRLWEGTLGSPASYGCIILGLQEAETFYQWAQVGVVVVIV